MFLRAAERLRPETPDAAGPHPSFAYEAPFAHSARALFDVADGARSERAGEATARLLETLREPPARPLAIAMTLPFCAAHCLCCERDVLAAQPVEVIDDYLDTLCAEVDLVAGHLGPGQEVLSLHLGGGSASELGEPQLVRLLQALQRRFALPAEAALHAELDPRRTRWSELELLAALGFRHASFGVLELDEGVQAAIGRRQSAALVEDVCDLARRCGIECITLQLMVGLPRQTLSGWQATLRRLLAIAPDRIEVKRYRHQPRAVPSQCAIDPAELLDAAGCQALVDQAAAELGGAGYRWIGADCFVLDGDPLAVAAAAGQLRRGLLDYSAGPAQPLIGLGCAAVGEVDGRLWWNEASREHWRAGVRAGLLPAARWRDADALALRRRGAVEQLLCEQRLPFAAVLGGLEADYLRVAAFERDGWVEVDEGGLRVTPAGRHALVQLCMALQPVAPATAEER